MKKSCIMFALMLVSQFTLATYSTDVKTKYPIVLIHGLFGFGDHLSFIARYWGNLPDLLSEHGATVYIAEVSQAHMAELRGLQLYAQLIEWGHEKYNLIGHSHGGLDARFVLNRYPEIVASVTTISSPHRGSKVADSFVDAWEGTITGTLLGMFGDLFSHTIGFLSGSQFDQDASIAMHGLTTDGIADFNERYPAGMSASECDEGPHEYMDRKLYSWGSYGIVPVSPFDITAKLFQYFSQAFDENELNDGLVSVCSMKFGRWLGARANAHHLVPIGGVVAPLLEEHIMYSIEMIMNHANRLKRANL